MKWFASAAMERSSENGSANKNVQTCQECMGQCVGGGTDYEHCEGFCDGACGGLAKVKPVYYKPLVGIVLKTTGGGTPGAIENGTPREVGRR